jgi:hypothetical protein
MLKALVRGVLGHFGYRLVRHRLHDFPLNPRIDQQDWQESLAVIARVTKHHEGSMTWDRSQRYLGLERVNFYYAVLEAIEESDILRDGARVLDVGVYFGYMLRILHKFHPSVHYFGTETHETRLAIAQELCPFATIWQAAIDDLDGAERFDLVLLTEVLEHLVHPEQAVHKLARLSRALFLTVPDGRSDTTSAMKFHPEWESYRGHINFWSPESWENWLNRELPNYHIRTGTLPTDKIYAMVQSKSP